MDEASLPIRIRLLKWPPCFPYIYIIIVFSFIQSAVKDSYLNGQQTDLKWNYGTAKGIFAYIYNETIFLANVEFINALSVFLLL